MGNIRHPIAPPETHAPTIVGKNHRCRLFLVSLWDPSFSLLTARTACRELFVALEECHANNWLKWTGGCNQAKIELNKCLHAEVSASYPLPVALPHPGLLPSLFLVLLRTERTPSSGKPSVNKHGKNYMQMTRPSPSLRPSMILTVFDCQSHQRSPA